jgi:hypothetical protein
MHISFWWISHKEKAHYEDLDISRRIILKWILEDGLGLYGLDSSGSG